jgi:hypothetical protein
MKILAMILALLLVSTAPAFAEPRYTAAKRAADKVKKDERDLARKAKRLSAKEKARLKSAFRGKDSDSDGVADIIEGAFGSGSCESDSDDDGLPDDEDIDEDNPDRDGDGHMDGNEVAAKGTITSFADPLVTVGNRTFIITGDTQFRGVNFGPEDLEPGLCVEVEGHTNGATTVADKVKRDDDCN